MAYRLKQRFTHYSLAANNFFCKSSFIWQYGTDWQLDGDAFASTSWIKIGGDADFPRYCILFAFFCKDCKDWKCEDLFFTKKNWYFSGKIFKRWILWTGSTDSWWILWTEDFTSKIHFAATNHPKSDPIRRWILWTVDLIDRVYCTWNVAETHVSHDSNIRFTFLFSFISYWVFLFSILYLYDNKSLIISLINGNHWI